MASGCHRFTRAQYFCFTNRGLQDHSTFTNIFTSRMIEMQKKKDKKLFGDGTAEAMKK